MDITSNPHADEYLKPQRKPEIYIERVLHHQENFDACVMSEALFNWLGPEKYAQLLSQGQKDLQHMILKNYMPALLRSTSPSLDRDTAVPNNFEPIM